MKLPFAVLNPEEPPALNVGGGPSVLEVGGGKLPGGGKDVMEAMEAPGGGNEVCEGGG